MNMTRATRATAQRMSVWPLLEAGLSPIPVHPTTRHPLVPWGELDRLGYRLGIGQDRTGQYAGSPPSRWVPLVFEWWDTWPHAGAAILTGLSRLLVIDVDPRNGGHQTFAELVRTRPLPATRVVRTRSGGLHLYYRSSTLVQSKTGQLGAGIDVKSARAIVICPPTPGYELVERHPIAAVPAWLLARCQPTRQRQAPRLPRALVPPDSPQALAELADALQTIRDAAPGTRHDVVYRTACHLFTVTDSDQIEATLVAAAQQASEPREWRDRARAVADARAFIRSTRR